MGSGIQKIGWRQYLQSVGANIADSPVKIAVRSVGSKRLRCPKAWWHMVFCCRQKLQVVVPHISVKSKRQCSVVKVHLQCLRRKAQSGKSEALHLTSGKMLPFFWRIVKMPEPKMGSEVAKNYVDNFDLSEVFYNKGGEIWETALNAK